MRTLSEIYSEKRWIAANLKKAGPWCAIGLAIRHFKRMMHNSPFIAMAFLFLFFMDEVSRIL